MIAKKVRRIAAVLACAAIVASCAGTRVPSRMPDTPETEVRATLDAWRAAMMAHDSASLAKFYAIEPFAQAIGAKDDTVRARKVLAQLARATEEIGFARTKVAVYGDSANAFPISYTQYGRTYLVRGNLRKSPNGWRISELRWVSPEPVEFRLPGLGEEYYADMEEWAARSLAWSRETLRANPPGSGDPRLRKAAHAKLDEVLHLKSAPSMSCTSDFLRTGIDSVIADLRTERVTEGVTIWKLYNHGFIVRTPNYTWAHDFYEGGEAAITQEQIDALLAEIDVLFCSHRDQDHTSMLVIGNALKKGVPVFIAPVRDGEPEPRLLRMHKYEMAYLGSPDSLTPPAGLTIVSRTAPDDTAAGEVAGLRWFAYPGHQGVAPNWAFVVEADGMSFMHFGDQDHVYAPDLQWIDSVRTERRIDVFLPNVWTDQFDRVIRGIAPRIVIPGHENELGHPFEHREPYDQAYEKLERNSRNVEAWYVLAWGERVHVPSR